MTTQDIPKYTLASDGSAIEAAKILADAGYWTQFMEPGTGSVPIGTFFDARTLREALAGYSRLWFSDSCGIDIAPLKGFAVKIISDPVFGAVESFLAYAGLDELPDAGRVVGRQTTSVFFEAEENTQMRHGPIPSLQGVEIIVNVGISATRAFGFDTAASGLHRVQFADPTRLAPTIAPASLLEALRRTNTIL